LHPASKFFAKSNQILDGITLGLPFDIANSATSTRPKIIIYSTQWLQSDVGLQSFWLPAGSYRMHWFTADGSPVGNGAWLDGHRSATYEISRAGFFHTASPPLGATTLVFAESGAADPISSGSIGTRRSATSWDVQTPRTGTVRATVLNDHHWSLDGEGRHYDGFDCDLVDTCFGEIPRGRYVLRHQWPDAVIFGIVASLLVWLVSFTLCWMASERFRRLESGR
jgi:hypothetical protein